MGLGDVSWLLSNPTILAILAGFIAAMGWGFRQRIAGAKAERDKQAKHRLDAIKDRKELDDEVADLGHADLDDRFKRWLQDNR